MTGRGTPAAPARSPSPPSGGQLVNALPHPVLVLDHDNRIIFVNAAGEDFFRSGASQLAQLRLDDLVGFASPLIALVAQVRLTGSSVHEYGVDLGSPRTGEARRIDIFGRLLGHPPGQIVLVLQERAMARMIERQLSHRGVARSVSAMASVLAHEIKNPLSGIRGAAQLIEPDLDDEGRALTRLICAETDRICGLVDQMERFSDDRPIRREPLNIHAVLDHVKQLASSGFAARIKFEERYDPSLPRVLGDRDRLVQAVLNLVKNAAEAIGPGRRDGRITLATAFRPGVRLTVPGTAAHTSLPLMISISDNGPGVGEDIRAHLFEPFVTSKASGRGLGLALVAKIIGDHGGTIELRPLEPGSAIRILLPMHSVTAGKADG